MGRNKKYCRGCGNTKELRFFFRDKHSPDGYKHVCKECDIKRKMEYRKTENGKISQSKGLKKIRRKYAEWFQSLKSGLKCELCPETHPAALDFHHKDPSTKLFTIAAGHRTVYNKEKILAEIAKCRVLCANCHRKLEYEKRKSDETLSTLTPSPK